MSDHAPSRTSGEGDAADSPRPPAMPPLPALRVEPSPRWVRAQVGGEWLIDSRRALLVFGIAYTPRYAFPEADIDLTRLRPAAAPPDPAASGADAGADASPGGVDPAGARRWFDLHAPGGVVANAAWDYPEPSGAAEALRGHRFLAWEAADQWYEEDEPVYIHPRDPYHRVDALRSSRRVQVRLGGAIVADSQRPVLLFETGLPVRYYLPPADVRLDLLEPSATVTGCPYKGNARYWSASPSLPPRDDGRPYTDIAWSYPFPVPECPRIEGLVAFYDEQVEAVLVDGVEQPPPHTIWGL